jgi:hypothetical protein
MRTYHLPFEIFLPLLRVCKVLNRDVGFYGGLYSGCNLKKSRHRSGVWDIEVFGSRSGRVEVKNVLADFCTYAYEE